MMSEQKTEGLSFQEACAAIGRGECVQSRERGVIFGPKGTWEGNFWIEQENSTFKSFKPIYEPFRIVPDPSKEPRYVSVSWPKPEEPKSLTFEEALACEKVRIEWPDSFGGSEYKSSYEKGSGWLRNEIEAFDLAERRGYRMTEVKE